MADLVHAPATGAIATLDVPDFERWKKAFDDFTPQRHAKGRVVRHLMLRSMHVPTRVKLDFAVRDRQALERWVESEEVQEGLRQAGISPPHVQWRRVVEDLHVPKQQGVMALIEHSVGSFQRWKEAFDASAAERARAGLIGHRIAHVEDDRDQVILFLQAADADTLRRYVESPGFGQRMRQGGVRGRLDYALYQLVEERIYEREAEEAPRPSV